MVGGPEGSPVEKPVYEQEGQQEVEAKKKELEQRAKSIHGALEVLTLYLTVENRNYMDTTAVEIYSSINTPDFDLTAAEQRLDQIKESLGETIELRKNRLAKAEELLAA